VCIGDEAKKLSGDARQLGNAATVAIVVGAAAVAGGVILWLTAPPIASSDGASAALAIRPTGMALRVAF
jgi:hypothetical protein